MPEPIRFHTDLYRREAVQSAAEKYLRKARIALAESNGDIVAEIEPAAPMSDTELSDLHGDFMRAASRCASWTFGRTCRDPRALNS